jgi:hypothetical protein
MSQVTIVWNWEDVQSLRPDWTQQDCEQYLDQISRVLTERSIEEGWYILRDLLSIEEN